MLIVTHLLCGLLGLKLLGWTNALNVFFVVIGSTLPDLDYKVGLKHRAITHSLLFLLPCLLIPPLALGMGLHFILDLLTPTGVMLLYPKREYYILMGAPLSTGRSDTIVCTLLLGGLIL